MLQTNNDWRRLLLAHFVEVYCHSRFSHDSCDLPQLMTGPGLY